jgi:phosphopantothenoylcysteine decarboxylase/phosphopantothenate--cysteine ligase
LSTPHGVHRIDVESAEQMLGQVLALANAADVYIGVAAVADWRAANISAEKLKKRASATPPTLQLANNPDILATVAALPSPPLCVGFAAESEHVLEHARAKLRSKGVALIVANQVRDAVGSDEVELTIVDTLAARTLPRAPKLVQARHIMAAIGQRLGTRAKP